MIGMSDLEHDRILGQLRAGPATIARLAERLGMAEGVLSYHLTVLKQTGRVQVATTRRVRGVPERTYASVGSSAPAPSAPAAAVQGSPSAPRMRDVRQVAVDAPTFYEFAERLSALADEFSARGTPGAPVAELSITLYRPASADAGYGYGYGS
jgi:DNA-binding transcriptional ArsR family regulator